MRPAPHRAIAPALLAALLLLTGRPAAGQDADAASYAILPRPVLLAPRAGSEWIQLFVSNLVLQMRARGRMAALAACMREEPAFNGFLRDYQALLGDAAP